MSNGPSITGINYSYDVAIGATYTPLAEAVVSDPSSSFESVSVTLSNPTEGVLIDPNSGTDGGSYNSTTGVYTVSGTPAEVTAALEGLEFQPATNAFWYAYFTIDVVDGAALSASADPLILIYPAGGDIIPVDNAQISTASNSIVWLVGGTNNSVTFNGQVGSSDDWGNVYGNDGTLTLNAAEISVFGANDQVIFSTYSNSVSFYGPSDATYTESVSGSNGIVIENGVNVTLSGADDTIYFNNTDGNILNLSAPAPGSWSELVGLDGGQVNLDGSSLSIVGGQFSITTGSFDDAVSLYQTDGRADTVLNGDATVILNDSQAVAEGDGDSVWFENGSASTVTTNSASDDPDTVYGAGTIDIAGGAISSIGGGAVIDFLAGAENADVSYTNGIWDRVQGQPGSIDAFSAQLSIIGGGQTLNFVGGIGNAASLYETNGSWDAVYGSNTAITLNSAEAGVVGGGNKLWLYGSSSVSLSSTGGVWDGLYGNDQTAILDNAQAAIVGGGNTLWLYGSSSISLASTNGAWDAVEGSNQTESLDDAQATIIGDGDTLFLGGANAFTLSGSSDQLVTGQALGQQWIVGFGSSDTMQFSAADFANFSVLQGDMTQSGPNTIVTLNSSNAVTLYGVQASSLQASQFSFV